MPNLNRYFVVVITAVAVPLLAALGFGYSPEFRAVLLTLSGRAPSCGFVASIKAIPATAEQIEQTQMFQRTSRLVTREGGFELWDTRMGPIWILGGQDMMSVYRELAEQETDIYEGIKPGDIVLDCGARYGLFTKTALSRRAKLVVAIEPAADTTECLRRNLAAEIQAGRVILIPKGVWDKEEVLRFFVDPENSARNSFVETRGILQQEIPVTTIDSIVHELRLDRVDFVKMDIEGAERNALAGAAITLRRFRPRMAICVYHRPDDPDIVPAVVRQARNDYKTECACKDWGFRLQPEVMFFR